VSGLSLTKSSSDDDRRVLEWNGTSWLVDGELEEEAERRARVRMMERFNEQKRQREANATAGNSTGSNASATSSDVKGGGNSMASASPGNASEAAAYATSRGGNSAPAQAMLTCLYSARGAFMEDGLLLQDERMAKIRHIPCIAVQGASDLICPPVTAYDLHRAWPEMKLRIVKGSGHSMYDAGITSELIRATDSLRDRVDAEEEAQGHMDEK